MKTEGEIKMGESFFWKDKAKGILRADLFSSVAEAEANKIATDKIAKKHKPTAYTQIRKFYDEVLRYKVKISANESEFEKYLPYVRMINAKLTYANAKENLSEKCLAFFKAHINEISDVRDFYAFADFFEAFMAFYKKHSEGNK